ncbi:MAG: response regulator [Burkholderiales bacterium]
MNEHQASLLLIDDEEPNRVLITRRLQDIGHRVTSAPGGHAGLELMRAERFDLVLLDLQMPELDGLATLDLIKSDPALETVPVIMLTASRTRESVIHCLSLGAADYLIKPVVPAELQRRVQAALDKGTERP